MNCRTKEYPFRLKANYQQCDLQSGKQAQYVGYKIVGIHIGYVKLLINQV